MPFGSNVAVWKLRTTAMLPVGANVPLGWAHVGVGRRVSSRAATHIHRECRRSTEVTGMVANVRAQPARHKLAGSWRGLQRRCKPRNRLGRLKKQSGFVSREPELEPGCVTLDGLVR